MKKDALLAEIENLPQFELVIGTTCIDVKGRLKTYRSQVLEVTVDNRRADIQNVTFFVVDEGEPTESAFYRSQFPSEDLEPLDKATVEAYLDAIIPHFGYEYLKYSIDQRWVKVKVYEIVPGSSPEETREQVYFLFEDDEGNPSHWPHTEYLE